MPAEFQQTFDMISQDISQVLEFFYDIFLVTVGTEDDRREIVDEIFERLVNAKISDKLRNCHFQCTEVDWLAHQSK